VETFSIQSGGFAARPGQHARMLICEPEPFVASGGRADDVFATSPSALEDFLICPRRYFYARVLHLYDVISSPRQALGQVVHAALHDLKVAGEAMVAPGELVDRHWPAGQQRFGTRLREAAFRRLAEQAVAQVAAFDAEHGAGEYVGGEVPFRWQIMPAVELRGTIDRIDRAADGLVVLDYKLGATSPSIAALLSTFAPPQEEATMASWRPSDLQLPLYALAIEQSAELEAAIAPGEQVSAVGLIYPLQLYTARGKPAAAGRRMLRIVDHGPGCSACAQHEGNKRPEGVLCRDQLRRIADRARMAIEEMRAGTITPDPIEGSRTCAGCAFRAICPAPQA
jgi:CRISPR/Cas system-associated exonuclease Cas4 (RecB family)